MSSERHKHTIELLREATDGVLNNSQPVTPSVSEELIERAKEAAYRLLSVRDRSVHELRGRLLDKGFSESIVDDTIGRLTEVGLLDDATFARNWVQHRAKYNAKGKRLLHQELRHKGISDEIISTCLEELSTELQKEAATSLVDKRARRISAESIATREGYQKAKQRLYNMLLRRGFNYDLALQLADEALKNVQNQSDD